MPPSSFKRNEVLRLGKIGGAVLDLSVWIRKFGGPSVSQQPLTSVQMAELPRIDPSVPGTSHCNGGNCPHTRAKNFFLTLY